MPDTHHLKRGLPVVVGAEQARNRHNPGHSFEPHRREASPQSRARRLLDAPSGQPLIQEAWRGEFGKIGQQLCLFLRATIGEPRHVTDEGLSCGFVYGGQDGQERQAGLPARFMRRPKAVPDVVEEQRLVIITCHLVGEEGQQRTSLLQLDGD